MAEKKSVIEEALLDAKKIQEALNANTKEILRSVAREEIDSVVTESLKEDDDYDEEDLESNDDEKTDDQEPVQSTEDSEAVEPSDDEESKDVTSDTGIPQEVDPIEGDQEIGKDTDEVSDDEELDLTGASDDEVIAIYKKLSGNDQIEVIPGSNGDIRLKVNEPGEYVIKTDEPSAETEIPTDIDSDLEEIPTGDQESEYEIALDDEDENDEQEEVEESIAVNRVAQNRAGGDLTDIKGPGAKQGSKVAESEVSDNSKLLSEATIKYNALLTESNNLKKENEEFKVALKKFRGMLVETVVFNSNLTYVTRLFMEHATTKDEKHSIIKRFDEEVSNLKESKKLYKTIANELASKKPITETVENKIIKTVTSSNSPQLNESTAYVDPGTLRIIDLMKRTERK